MKAKVQEIVSGYGFGISVKDLAVAVYRKLTAAGEMAYIVNERYVGVNGKTYQFLKTRSKGQWTVREI